MIRARRLRANHTLAIIMIGVISSATQLFTHHSLEKSPKLAEVVNLAGQQRMIAERIYRLSVEFALRGDLALETRLTEALSRWTTSHRALIDLSDVSSGYSVVVAMLEGLNSTQRGVTLKVQRLVRAATPTERQAIAKEIGSLTREFLQTMQPTVKRIEELAVADTQRIQTAEIIGLAMILSMLVFVSARIFRPAADRIEKELDARAALEHRLQHRNRQLRRTMARARTANRSRSTFLANMNHELRTPLNGVLGVAEMLSQTALTSNQRELTEVLQASAGMLSSQIDGILDLSSLDAKRVRFSQEEFDLRDVIHDALKMILPTANEKKLSIDWRIDSTVHRVLRGDPTRLRQILFNLLSNAVKFTDAGEVSLHVESQADGNTRFSVTDTGMGIDPTELKRMFLPFQQAKMGSDRVFGGTGIGLTICRRLVEEQGGTFGADSNPGEGSTFWFVLGIPTAGSPPNPIRLLDVRALVMVNDAHRRHHVVNTLLSYGATAIEWRTTSGPGGTFDVYIVDASNEDIPDDVLNHAVRIGNARTGSEPRGESGANYCEWPLHEGHFLRAVDLAINEQASRDVAEAEAAELSVLVVDDNPINQRIARSIIAGLGHKVDVATDGEASIRTCVENQYDLILMDLHMPGMDGIEATRAIRKLPTGREPAIIAFSADVRDDVRSQCNDAGMNGFLRKPIDKGALNRLIDQVSTIKIANVSQPLAAAMLRNQEASL